MSRTLLERFRLAGSAPRVPVQAPTGAALGRARRPRFARVAVLGVMAVLLLGAACSSVVVVRRQAALGRISRYNLTMMASMAGLEVDRLRSTILASLIPGSKVDEDELDLRLAVVENRLRAWEGGDGSEFIASSPEVARIIGVFREVIREAREELDKPLSPGRGERLMRLVGTLNAPAVQLAAAANSYSSEQETQDKRELNMIHWTLAALLAVITVFCLALLVLAMRQNAMLETRRLELSSRSQRFDAALTNMSQALCMIDADGCLVVVNARFGELFGLGKSDALPGDQAGDIFARVAAKGRYPAAMVEAIGARQAQHAADGTSASFVEEDSTGSGQALAVTQEPMADGGWVATFEDVTERRRTEARIYHMAHYDALTGLPNRVLFQSELEGALARKQTVGQEVAILCLDLDQFKAVNDTLGHPGGDRLLQLAASRLRECVRDGDLVARLGGDEFAVLQSGAVQPAAAEATAARIVFELGRPYELDGHRVVTGASVGAALADEGQGSADALLTSADIALYRAKAQGRGAYEFYAAEMGAEVMQRRRMEADLRDALGGGDFAVYYQPLYGVAADRVCGYEALLRWRHPKDGLVSPALFIPIAEETGLITQVGEWVLEQACTDATAWPSDLKVAINLSPVQFRTLGLVEAVQRALARSGLAASRLELEVTESALLHDSDRVLATFRELQALGVRLVLDDFGTGYSSLSYLGAFPFNKVKIDRSFVRDITSRPDCESIVRAIADLARSLGMTTTAEGVETEEQLRRVRHAGCTEVQGFLFDRPKPLRDIRFSRALAA